ncbi:MAG TPA: flagellar hook-basal body complex protein [Candidatus Krumholzibacteria bacterium]|nr:flagellar hook-basal body complex protein [Candidatus Krumholzibacteria bacterium]HPD71622.1 flagellar hook-basal body complex protein [Candidatus Krumholzibacteria bacterium]HRY41445.1 flagellar hook-basal body complex protein [Candidatus Krumholzibacteria bacterium]
MFKSLYSGVSGMSANLTSLDVIGNNIANSNTIGFKSGRVTFNEMLTQTIRSASRPVSGGLGGTNPQQIGLGTQVGSIDTNFNQGNFTTTGLKTDLAIQGPGFFILSDGTSNSYTRAGVFGLDAGNFLVNPSTGLRLQGVMADADGNLANGPIGDLFIDPGMVVPAQASTTVELIGNLDADSDARGSVLETGSLLVAASAADLLVDLSGQTRGSLNVSPGDLISLNGTVGGVDIATSTFEVTTATSLQDLLDWLNTQNAGIAFSMSADPTVPGAIQVSNASGSDLESLSLSISGRNVFNENFIFPATIPTGATATTADVSDSAGQLRGFADAGDALVDLFTANGTQLGLDLSGGSTSLVIGGDRGGAQVTDTIMAVDATTTLGDLLTEIQQTFSINSNPVVVNAEGEIVVQGEVGLASAIGMISIAELNTDNNTVTGAFGFNTSQQARDQQTFSVSTTVYDSLGGEHTVTFQFEKVPGENEWIWEAEIEGGEEIIEGGSGRMRFNDTGAISNFSYDDNATGLVFLPQDSDEEGAQLVDVAIDYGDIGGLNGLTQFEGTGQLKSMADGYTAGSLVDFEIDQAGLLVGRFSNDTMRNIGRIALVQFNNESGLVREANNTYTTSGNSGDPLTVFAGEGNGINLTPGALETSNVDLAQEFTRMVVAQRAFQANSRVVTTADTLMQELVNLVR